jgi:hypothetical protein
VPGVSALPDDVDARVDELYCVPLDRFVPARVALVKELRAEKRRAEAEAVNRLQKPALAAWAVNQVVRSQPKAATALWAAGDAVLAVQERAVAGRASGAELREAIAAQRDALAPLADAARGMLSPRGAFLNEQAVQAVIETLHAAAVDREARPDVERGRLARPLRLAGLGALPALAATRPAAVPEETGSAAADEEREADEREAAAREAEARAAAERERAAAERELERAVRARDAARERVERRREELRAAEDELERLDAEVRAAEERLGG